MERLYSRQAVRECLRARRRAIHRLLIGEGVEDAPSGSHVALEERLHELRDVLPEVGMEPVDVLRPLTFRQILLSPVEV